VGGDSSSEVMSESTPEGRPDLAPRSPPGRPRRARDRGGLPTGPDGGQPAAGQVIAMRHQSRSVLGLIVMSRAPESARMTLAVVAGRSLRRISCSRGK
jgi:hypothetical protein